LDTFLTAIRRGGSLYRLALTFPHTDRTAVLELTGKLSESDPAKGIADNESWAVSKVVVSALPASPVRPDDRRFAQHWQALADKDPVRANEAAAARAARDHPHPPRGLHRLLNGIAHRKAAGQPAAPLLTVSPDRGVAGKVKACGRW